MHGKKNSRKQQASAGRHMLLFMDAINYWVTRWIIESKLDHRWAGSGKGSQVGWFRNGIAGGLVQGWDHRWVGSGVGSQWNHRWVGSGVGSQVGWFRGGITSGLVQGWDQRGGLVEGWNHRWVGCGVESQAGWFRGGITGGLVQVWNHWWVGSGVELHEFRFGFTRLCITYWLANCKADIRKKFPTSHVDPLKFTCVLCSRFTNTRLHASIDKMIILRGFAICSHVD